MEVNQGLGLKEEEMTVDIKDEIKGDIRETTQLFGDWKEVKISCPECRKEKKDSSEFVYLYDDQKTCYCTQHNLEFLALDQADEDDLNHLNERLDEMITDDPKTVSEMTDRLLNNTEERCPSCDGRNHCHYSTCPKAPSFTKDTTSESNYVEAGCPHGWHYLTNCEICKPKQLPAYQHKSWDGRGTNYTTSYINTCNHPPQHIIDGNGWGVWAGKKDNCRSYAQQFDVVLNLTFTSMKEPHIIPIPELAEFEEYNCDYKEIQLDWPDYEVINLPREFWVKLIKYLEENHLRMLVLCLGGHGRTGTALAVMMCLALDYTPEDAVKWVRENYCREAIETDGQREYINTMVAEGKEKAEAAGAGE